MMLGNCNIVVHGSVARQMSSASVVHFETSTKKIGRRIGVTLVSLSTAMMALEPVVQRCHSYTWSARLLSIVLITGIISIPLQVRRLPRSGEEEAVRFQIATSTCFLVFIATYLFTRH
jgi:hypothetical protein